MKKRIHVNQHIIRANKAHGENNPPLTIKTYKDNIKATFVRVMGESNLIYSQENPLDCGAHVWIETDSPVAYFSDDGNGVIT